MDAKKQKKTIKVMWIISVIFLLIVLLIGFIALRKPKENGFQRVDRKAKATFQKIEKVFDK